MPHSPLAVNLARVCAESETAVSGKFLYLIHHFPMEYAENITGDSHAAWLEIKTNELLCVLRRPL